MSGNSNKLIPELRLNWELAVDMLIRFIDSEVRQAGFTSVVAGLSGGVDSALSTALAVKALGAENVHVVKMPYCSSSPESSADADRFAEKFGIKLRAVDISRAVDAFFELLPGMNSVRKGNVMARARMITLFDIAAEKSALVLGTGNKTEILLGYTTWYGDCACSINPIGDLYKTQVWAMAEYLGVPPGIISKAPSADLWAGQTDEGELGITYEEADKILFRLVDKRMPVEEVIADGFDKDTVTKVHTRMHRMNFKRVLPPIAKLSPRTVGKDFNYARDLDA